MGDLSEAKVGDKLYVEDRFGSGRIVVVDSLTPGGLVVTKSGTFTPRGRKYGDGKDLWSHSRARLATEDDFAKVRQANLVGRIVRFRDWDKLTPDELSTVASIVDRREKCQP